MFEKTSKHNQVSELSSSVSDAKTHESLNNKVNNELLLKNSLVQVCKDNITQLNDTNKKG